MVVREHGAKNRNHEQTVTNTEHSAQVKLVATLMFINPSQTRQEEEDQKFKASWST